MDVPFVPDWFENLAGELAADLLSLPIDSAERLLGVAERLARSRAQPITGSRRGRPGRLLVRILKASATGSG